ncbi:queuosine biosynthesis protein QueD [Mycobacteroides abscessus subsp. abscessus]|nr:queuosine biosynthesis protein QueD [Mycobacteroides abscessus subsp. abscessus]
MSYSTITVAHNAETGHRILGLSGPGAKCSNVHGHSFWIEWTFAVDNLEADGVEFGAVKAVLREWVDENIDHGFVCHRDDPIGHHLLNEGCKVHFLYTPPTTEAIATLLADKARELLPDLELLRVVVREGRKNQASWEAV